MARRTISQLNKAYGFLPGEPFPGKSASGKPIPGKSIPGKPISGKPISDKSQPEETFRQSSAHPRFVTTGDFIDIAHNHCCATMVTNFLLQGYAGDDAVRRILFDFRNDDSNNDNGCAIINDSHDENLRQKNNISVHPAAEDEFKETAHKVFMTVHQYVGNGPVFSLRRANRFLRDTSIHGRFQHIHRKNLFSILSSGHPAALLVAASPLDWHWILAVGISESSPSAAQPAPRKGHKVPAIPSDHFSNPKHSPSHRTLSLQVINNWESDTLKTYTPSHGAKILAVWIYKER